MPISPRVNPLGKPGVNPGLPGLGFKPYFGNVGNNGEYNILNVQNCANLLTLRQVRLHDKK